MGWFDVDEERQIFRDPEYVLKRIFKKKVMKNMRNEDQVYLSTRAEREIAAIHSVIPDDVDSFGNLPQFRCGWKKCGRVFTNRDQLLDHVQKYFPQFMHRFHLNSKNVLSSNPNMEFDEFVQKVQASFPAEKAAKLGTKEYMKALRAFYDQYVPICQALAQNSGDGDDGNYVSRIHQCRPGCVLCLCTPLTRGPRKRWKFLSR